MIYSDFETQMSLERYRAEVAMAQARAQIEQAQFIARMRKRYDHPETVTMTAYYGLQKPVFSPPPDGPVYGGRIIIDPPRPGLLQRAVNRLARWAALDQLESEAP